MPTPATSWRSIARGKKTAPGRACADASHAVKIIRARDCRTTPWKNGGGSTTEVAVAPAGASLDNFDWRVSLARVASDGPFSEFPGIDRSLAVVKGEGLVLSIGQHAPLTLSRGSEPISFFGDVA